MDSVIQNLPLMALVFCVLFISGCCVLGLRLLTHLRDAQERYLAYECDQNDQLRSDLRRQDAQMRLHIEDIMTRNEEQVYEKASKIMERPGFASQVADRIAVEMTAEMPTVHP